MPKYSSENERVKRDYAFFLETASGKQDATIDAALRAIDRFETSTSHKPFSKFHIGQVPGHRQAETANIGHSRIKEHPGARYQRARSVPRKR